jgi:hypothetical protein
MISYIEALNVLCVKQENSSFPILPIDAFTLNYNDKHGVDLEFRPRNKNNEKPTQQ